jgi:site-specific recombinase XerD
MRVQRISSSDGTLSFELLDDSERPMPEVSGFMRFLSARGCSPNTLSAYSHDLLHFARFLDQSSFDFNDFSPARSILFLEYLRSVPSRKQTQRYSLVLCRPNDKRLGPGTRLSPATINRIVAAVSSFYEYLILSGQLSTKDNPVSRYASGHASRHHSPDQPVVRRSEDNGYLPTGTNWQRQKQRQGYGGDPGYRRYSRQQPVRRMLSVKTVQHLPRPMSDEQVQQLLHSLRRWRDKAMILLMLQGGLRPGEVLNLHLEDVQYGRRRIAVRYRTDHPKGVRTKSRRERIVDLHEPEALQALATYVMRERPLDAQSTYLFLVGGKGKRRHEPIGYHALVKMFQRHCERLNIREYWMTPHALRHTHATKMWENGMRELTLQKRLGHASPESTRIYTRVSEQSVITEYRRALGLGEGGSTGGGEGRVREEEEKAEKGGVDR